MTSATWQKVEAVKVAIAGPRGLSETDWLGWGWLRQGLERHLEVAALAQADSFVSVNWQLRELIQAQRHGIARERRALVLLEPPSTLPVHGTGWPQRAFGLICSPSPLWRTTDSSIAFPWPQDVSRRLPPVDPSHDFRFTATMIAGQKRSAMKSSYYGLRRQVLQRCGHAGIRIGLAGSGWTESKRDWLLSGSKALVRATTVSPRQSSVREAYGQCGITGIDYVGRVDDKLQFMQQAPVSIVIENSPDYVSEKLVGAVCAGVAPLYVGPPLEDFGLSPAIAVRVPPDATAIAQRLRDLPTQEIRECISAGQQWLDSNGAARLSEENVMYELGAAIARRFRKSSA